MKMLLQCPCAWNSPSRNHTPGTICLTVPGCASPETIRAPAVTRIANAGMSQSRAFFIDFVVYTSRGTQAPIQYLHVKAYFECGQACGLTRFARIARGRSPHVRKA